MFKSIVLQIVLSIFCAYLNANQKINADSEQQIALLNFLEKADSTLQEEFENICSLRSFLWTTSEYELAQHIISNDLVRAPGCVAFAYNNTVPYYNASTICWLDKCYIACEGPRSKDIPAFFHLLRTHYVTHLVRLTDSYEGEIKKCHPYWDGLLTESADRFSLSRENFR